MTDKEFKELLEIVAQSKRTIFKAKCLVAVSVVAVLVSIGNIAYCLRWFVK